MQSPAELLALAPEHERTAFLESLTDDEAAALLKEWRGFHARPDQLAPEGDWDIWCILAGRGFGKTRAGSEWIKERVEGGAQRIALVGETQRDLEKVMIEGDSGILACCPDGFVTSYTKKPVQINFHNGAMALGFNATEPDQLRGPQFDTAWSDELAKWRYARETWDQLQFGLRLGDPRQLVTTTPRPIELVRSILSGQEGRVVITRGRTVDNRANLAPVFLEKIEKKYAGTRLGRQELEGQVLGDMPGALWRQEDVDVHRVSKAPELSRILVAVDPAVTNTDESDEHGIIVAGLCGDEGYVLEDASQKGTPLQWARRVISLHDTFGADGIVVEVNQGGDMVAQTLRSVRESINIIEVRASRGKHVRAEPIAALYEQGRVHHVGAFAELETQMSMMTAAGYQGEDSPDRLDALVWAMTVLFPDMIEVPDNGELLKSLYGKSSRRGEFPELMTDKDILEEVRARYDEGWTADIKNREEMETDLRFVAGDQWPEDVRRERESNERPCITENHLTQFVRQVANDMRANPPAVKVIAGSGGAKKSVADILTGMIRDIEAKSATRRPYVTAGASAARCGIGHWRILTDYVSPTSFEQEILIEPITNPFAVVWDPVAVCATREDANWCFVVDELSEDEFARQYPDAKPVSFDNKDSEVWTSNWLNTSRKTVRVAEYWRKVRKPAKVCKLMDGTSGYKDELPKGIPPEFIVEERESDRVTIGVTKTNGFEVLEKTQVFPSRYIPIVPVVGEEYSVGAHKVRHSVIRFAKDSQTIHNYWLSTQTEHLALQPKAPFVATAKQVQKYADVWKTANTANHSVLIYDVDKDAPNSRPTREQPPASSAAFSEQIARAGEGMKSTTGIYAAGLGAQGNETSGKAIMARQREGDVGTFEFRDNLNASVEHTGRILVELIPVIYDTPRMVRILGEDGEEDFAEINKPQIDTQTGQQKIENNLKLGEYGVQVRSGPSYTTRRQEAAESMLQFVQTMPQAAGLVMDLVAKNMDWPGADEFAERFKRMLPPQVQPDTDNPEEQQQRQAMQAEQAKQAAKAEAMADAEIGVKQGQAAKAQADAQKSAAEATQTQMETMMASGQLQAMIQQLVAAQVQQALQQLAPAPPMAQPMPTMPPMNGGGGSL